MPDKSTSDDPSMSPVVVSGGEESAADLIRSKLDRLYKEEPEASEELVEAKNLDQLTKHQKFMYSLGESGKDLAAIQTAWHEYYIKLPDDEKREVWQEFYESQSSLTKPTPANKQPEQALASHKSEAAVSSSQRRKLKESRSTKDIQAAIRDKVTAGGKLQPKHHFQSLLFGLGMGSIVVIIFLFGFFNEVIIAPFIQPSRASASTPIIINSSGVAPTPNPEVIIPKINVEIPVNYNETSTDESVIENDLQDGVVHYPTTSLPGQDGNAAFFGHSSNNIFNSGKYKFAFVLLHTIVPGDTFYLTYSSKVYVYKVISRNIVDPSDVSVLDPIAGQTATATLITCDPPGTSLHRLIVVGQQISPDPSSNTVSPMATVSPSTTHILPADGQTLWGKFVQSLAGKVIIALVILSAIVFAIRKLVLKAK